MPKFHRIVCSLSFRSAAFERSLSGRSLVGGARGASPFAQYAKFRRRPATFE